MSPTGSLGSIVNHEDWVEQANCKQTDPDAFFPEQGMNAGWAKRVCGECPVQAECLAYALNRPEHHGIWGGLTERERKEVRRELRPPNSPPPPGFCPNGHNLAVTGRSRQGRCVQCNRDSVRKYRQRNQRAS
jgi:WhiB family redox-sensing transcriptional regulator